MYVAHILACRPLSPGFIVKAHARGRIGNNNEVQIPLVYIAHGTADNVLPIASTSRIFESSLRKNGYKVEFREFREAIICRPSCRSGDDLVNNGVSTTSL